ncbi:flippase [Halobacteria archaeon AArc-m2/3/4]|uniref:Flippase n=1 Tax=Natronoglomus mannanivorans TaxID=2979990 RepID=A0ABT2QIY2_9EURY|nr:flippase [Halobacteria archaeon AArc-m2/3/4]
MASKKITTDILVSGAIILAIRLRGIVFIPLITINLGVAAFGAYAQVLAIVTLLELVFGLGLYSALVRYGRRKEDVADIYYSLFVIVGIVSVILTILLVMVSSTLSSVALGSDEYADVFRIGSFLLITQILIRLARNYFRINSRIKIYSAIDGGRAYAQVLGVGITVLVLDMGLIEMFLSMVLIEAVILLILQIQIIREIGISIPSFSGVRMYLEYSIPVALSSLAGNVSSRADRVMIGFFLGASAVGVYSIAYQIAVSISMYARPIRQTYFPELSKFVDNNQYEECERFLRGAVRYFLIIAVPTIGGMFLIGPDVISILTQEGSKPSSLLVGTIALGIVAKGIGDIYGAAIDALEETALRAKFRGAGAVLNILINLIAIPTLGILGAAITTVITFFFTSSLIIRWVHSVIPSRIPFQTIVRCTTATFIMIWAGRTVFPQRLDLLVPLSAVLYFSLLFTMKELTVNELRKRIQTS